jgi:superfamily II DNA or RNA helicase
MKLYDLIHGESVNQPESIEESIQTVVEKLPETETVLEIVETEIEEKIVVETLPKREIKVEDENDTKHISTNFIEHKRVFVMGLYPGTGKSYLCEYMKNLNYNILVVCPTNQLAQDKNGITLNKFFSVGMTEDTKMNKFDDSKYYVIIFDE